jgi:hypothetical protein
MVGLGECRPRYDTLLAAQSFRISVTSVSLMQSNIEIRLRGLHIGVQKGAFCKCIRAVSCTRAGEPLRGKRYNEKAAQVKRAGANMDPGSGRRPPPRTSKRHEPRSNRIAGWPRKGNTLNVTSKSPRNRTVCTTTRGHEEAQCKNGRL